MSIERTLGDASNVAGIILMTLALVDRFKERNAFQSRPPRRPWFKGWVAFLALALIFLLVGILLLLSPRKSAASHQTEQVKDQALPAAIAKHPTSGPPTITGKKTSSPLLQQGAKRGEAHGQHLPARATGRPLSTKTSLPRALPATTPAVPQQNTQTCISSNCVQGNNFGPQTVNNYGPPKLVMTDEQESALADAMKPLPGMHVAIISVGEERDVVEYGSRIARALRRAGMTVEEQRVYMYPDAPPGVSMNSGADRMSDAAALATAMVLTGVATRPVRLTKDRDPSDLEVTVKRNQ